MIITQIMVHIPTLGGANYGYGYGWAYGWAYGYAATPAIPLYLGLMAIAGAYLVKGNLKGKE